MAAGGYLVRVALPWGCFGFTVEAGRVVRAAPVARWLVGRRGRAMVGYWRRQGAVVTWEAYS